MPAMFERGWAREQAWHGGMNVVDEPANAEQALEWSGLGGWELAKLPLFTIAGDGSRLEVPDRFAHVRMRDNRVLGVVGNVYRSVTNEDAFKWADELVGGFGAHYKTAGSLYGGKVVWVLLNVPFEINVGDQQLRTSIYLTNSHDGSSPVEAAFTTTNIVCANTLALARHSGVDRVRIKHCTNAEQKLAEAQKTMHLVEGARERSAALAEALFAKRITRETAGDVLDAVFPLPDTKGVEYDDLERGLKRSLSIAEDKRNAVMAIYAGAAGDALGQRQIDGTAWGLYNAFSAAYQHQPLLGKSDEDRIRKADAIFDNIMDAKSPADKALELLVAV